MSPQAAVRAKSVGAALLVAVGMGSGVGCGPNAETRKEVACDSIEERCGGTEDCFGVCMCEQRDSSACQMQCGLSENDPLLMPLGPRHADWADFEREAFELTNALRMEGGCCAGRCFAPSASLVMDESLQFAARRYAAELGRRGIVSHVGRSGRDAFARIRAAGVRSCAMGENLAARQATAIGAIQAWLDSPAHCENLYYEGFSRVGIGYAFALDSELGAVWVQEFAGP